MISVERKKTGTRGDLHAALFFMVAICVSCLFSGCAKKPEKPRAIDTQIQEIRRIIYDVKYFYNERMTSDEHLKPGYREVMLKNLDWFNARTDEIRRIRARANNSRNIVSTDRRHLVSTCLTAENIVISAREAYRRITTGDEVNGGQLYDLSLKYTIMLEEEISASGDRKPEPANSDASDIELQPNILFILIDTLRADHVGSYGYQRPTTPNIDTLASEGVQFNNAYSQAPHTPPSVASVLTGLYPSHHQLVTHYRWKGEKSLVEQFRKAGYKTAAFSANPIISPANNFAFGFDDFIFRLGATADLVNNDIYKWLLDYQRDKPLFMYVHYMDPHDTYDAPEPINRMFDPAPRVAFTDWIYNALKNETRYDFDPDIKGWFSGDEAMRLIREQRNFPLDRRTLDNIIAYYDAEIWFTDFQMGLLLKNLKVKKLMDNTIVVVVSDHGEGFLEHGYLKHGNTLYDELVHVPLIFWDGQKHFKPMKVDTPVELAGILPTLLETTGLPIPPGLDGTPLPTAYDTPDTSRARPVHSSTWYGRAVIEKKDIPKISIRRDRYKMIYTPYFALTELYDMENDSGEYENLMGKVDRETADSLRKELISYYNDFSWIQGKTEKDVNPEIIKQMKTLGYVQ